MDTRADLGYVCDVHAHRVGYEEGGQGHDVLVAREVDETLTELPPACVCGGGGMVRLGVCTNEPKADLLGVQGNRVCACVVRARACVCECLCVCVHKRTRSGTPRRAG